MHFGVDDILLANTRRLETNTHQLRNNIVCLDLLVPCRQIRVQSVATCQDRISPFVVDVLRAMFLRQRTRQFVIFGDVFRLKNIQLESYDHGLLAHTNNRFVRKGY